MKYVQMAHETPELAQVMVPALCDVVEWWADLLAKTNGKLEQVATPAQNLLNSWSMLAMSDSSFAEKILPCVLACLASKNENVSQPVQAQRELGPRGALIFANTVVTSLCNPHLQSCPWSPCPTRTSWQTSLTLFLRCSTRECPT